MDGLPIRPLGEVAQLQASRWLKAQLLLAPEEMELLLHELSPLSLFFAGRFYRKDSFDTHQKLFLEFYHNYIKKLSHGELPSESECQQFFSAALGTSPASFFLLQGQGDEYLLRTVLPVIQLQHHRFVPSANGDSIHSMVYGEETVSWGLQFSYPQLYIDSESGAIREMSEESSSPFRQLQRWLRSHTIPTPIRCGDNRFNAPIRLGRGCFSWIHRHPHLAFHDLSIDLPI